jgi:hypothetical protein
MEQKAQKHGVFYAWRVVNHTDAVVKRARVMGKNHSALGLLRDEVSNGARRVENRTLCLLSDARLGRRTLPVYCEAGGARIRWVVKSGWPL